MMKKNKSLLLIDTPKSCETCILFNTVNIIKDGGGYAYCYALRKDYLKSVGADSFEAIKKPIKCPLIPLPEKKHIFDIYEDCIFISKEEQRAYMMGYEDGYNDCIGDIRGDSYE